MSKLCRVRQWPTTGNIPIKIPMAYMRRYLLDTDVKILALLISAGTARAISD